MPHRELVSECAAPVVQHQDHSLAWAGLLDDILERREHLLQRDRAARLVDVEAWQREAHAAIAVLEEGGLRIPQAVGVGPAVDHDDRFASAALHENVDSVDLQRWAHPTSPPAAPSFP